MTVKPAGNIPESRVAPDFAAMDRAELEALAAAGEEVIEVRTRLAKTRDNVVGELLKGAGTFYEWNHYPDGDVYDPETASQFFYHAHPADLRVGEHGHFHTFLRPDGMPGGVAPAPVPNLEMPADPNDALSHLIGISMDKYGEPICLFTTNRWVTGEVWYAAADVVRMLERFEIGHTQPSWPVNRWITAMLRLFRPQIAALVAERDAAVAARERKLREQGSNESVYEDRGLEVTSFRTISVADQARAVAAVLDARG